MRRKTFWYMFFIMILGFVFRFLFINKPEGLWNDEYVSWSIASIPFGKGFIDAMLAQCHMPLYYFYLKFFMHFLGDSDLVLRLTSLVAGVVAIPVMYFVGKEFKDEKFGLFCAFFTSVSSFLIYFSQEVRFYELLFVVSALSLLYTLKLLKSPKIYNLLLYLFFNLLVILTHTIGCIFVLFSLLFVSYHFYKNNEYKKKIAITWAALFVISMLVLPILIRVATGHPLSQWWNDFSVAKIGFLFTDYFSPVLINLVSSPDKFFFNPTFIFFVFALIPALIGVFSIVLALKSKDKTLRGLFFVSGMFLSSLVLLSLSSKLVFLTKYSIEAYPTLILLFCVGFSEMRSVLKRGFIFVFFAINIFYLMFSPLSAFRLSRPEGHGALVDLLKRSDLKKGDILLINYYPKERFEKYYDFNDLDVISINKGTFSKYLGVKNKDEFVHINDSFFDKKFGSDIIDKLDENNRHGDKKLVIVYLNSVAMYSPREIQALLNSEQMYKKVPFLFMVFSHLKNREIELAMRELKFIGYEQRGSWTVSIFKK